MVKTCGQICDLCLGIRNARPEDAVAMVERPRISLAAPKFGLADEAPRATFPFMNPRGRRPVGGVVSQPVVPKPSALRVATLRAAHQLLDVPLVFEDAFALRILGPVEEESLRNDPMQHNTRRLNGLRASLVVRSKLAEEEWARSKRSGVRQFVILGAGLDTFAYRNQDHDSTRIFEVDLPSTQKWKRDCLRVAGVEEPAWLA